MDDTEYTATSWRVADRMLAVCAEYEERFQLDPLLLDRLDEKVAAFVRDPHDEGAKVELDEALLSFLAAAVEHLPDKQR
jgi:hypothetical protein